jgi:hypothetical protein
VSAIYTRVGYILRCDDCGVQSTKLTSPEWREPFGWASDDSPGGPHHYCAECRIEAGRDCGFDFQSCDYEWEEGES